MKKLIYLLLGIFLGTTISTIAFFSLIFKDEPEMLVPDVVGLSLSDATDVISSSNLRYTISYEASKEKEPIVISTNPLARSLVKKNTIIEIVLPDIKSVTKMPSWVNLDYKEIKSEIMAMRNMVSNVIIIESIDSSREGTIIKQNPKAGDVLSFDDTIVLTVSKKSNTLVIPDFIGLNKSEIDAFSKKNNISIEYRFEPSSMNEGNAFFQSIEAGTTIINNGQNYLCVKISTGIEFPDFIGYEVEAAKEICRLLNLDLEIEYVNEAYNNRVIGQKIENESVVLYVSLRAG